MAAGGWGLDDRSAVESKVFDGGLCPGVPIPSCSCCVLHAELQAARFIASAFAEHRPPMQGPLFGGLWLAWFRDVGA